MSLIVIDTLSSSFSAEPAQWLAIQSEMCAKNFYFSQSVGEQKWDGWTVTQSPVLEGVLKITALFLRLLANVVEFVCTTWGLFRLGNLDQAQKEELQALQAQVLAQTETIQALQSTLQKDDEVIRALHETLNPQAIENSARTREAVAQELRDSTGQLGLRALQENIHRLRESLAAPLSSDLQTKKLEMEQKIQELKSKKQQVLRDLGEAQKNQTLALAKIQELETKISFV